MARTGRDSLAAVEPGCKVITDGWDGYKGLKGQGYALKPRVVSGSGKTASALLLQGHRVVALLKRWTLATHQGAVSRDQLDFYVNEFGFRFN